MSSYEPEKVRVVTMRPELVMFLFKRVQEQLKLDERRLEHDIWELDHTLVTLDSFDQRLNNIEEWKACKEELERVKELSREIALMQ